MRPKGTDRISGGNGEGENVEHRSSSSFVRVGGHDRRPPDVCPSSPPKTSVAVLDHDPTDDHDDETTDGTGTGVTCAGGGHPDDASRPTGGFGGGTIPRNEGRRRRGECGVWTSGRLEVRGRRREDGCPPLSLPAGFTAVQQQKDENFTCMGSRFEI